MSEEQNANETQASTRQFAQAVEITTATYDRFARDYAERHEDMPPLWERLLDTFIDRLDEEAAAHPIPELGRPGDDISLEEYLNFAPVLDAGCGPGRDARALAAHGLPVLGIDLSQGMLDEAQERTARRLPQGSVRYAIMDLRRLDLPDACCRGVWCSASLLHLPRHVAPRAVAELTRVARADAPVVVFLKEQQSGGANQHFLPYFRSDEASPRRFFTYYTADEARILLTGAGLVVDDLSAEPNMSDPGGPGWLALLARKPEA